MVDRELDYIDFRDDDDAHRQRVDEASSPVSGTTLHHAAPTEIFVMPPRQRGPWKTPERPASQPRRSCVRITIQQRKNFLEAFREHADDMQPVQCAAKLCITNSSVENLLVKLRRGEGIVLTGYFNWKIRVDPFQHLVRLKAEFDPAVSMQDVRNDLEAIVKWNCVNTEALGREVVDEVVRLGTNVLKRLTLLAPLLLLTSTTGRLKSTRLLKTRPSPPPRSPLSRR